MTIKEKKGGEMSSNDFEEKLYQGLSGIKRVKKQRRISRFSREDGVLSETEASRLYVPGEGIVEGEKDTEIILDCGHSSGFGLGHVGECGHAVCMLCIQRHVLVCAKPGCFKNLCTVNKCKNSARSMIGVYFCRKHRFTTYFKVLSKEIFSGRRRTQEWMERINQNYYSIVVQEKRKRLNHGR